MTSRRLIVLILVALLPAGSLAIAGDDVQGEVAAGARAAHANDSLNRASEFQIPDDSPNLFAWIDAGFGDDSRMELDIKWLDSDEMDHQLRLDTSRSFRVDFDYKRLYHNLPHDPLTNLQAFDGEGKIVQHTDEAPAALYGVRWSEGSASGTWRPQKNRAWEVGLSGREVKREGTRQHRSTDHCYSCHIVGQSLPVDETLRDVSLQVGYLKPDWGVRYTATFREFSNDAADQNRLFDPAHHPVLTTPATAPAAPFGNRVQYGVLPSGVPAWYDGLVGLTTEFERASNVLSAYWTSDKNHVDGAIASYTVESEPNIDPLATPVLNQGGLNEGYDYDYTSVRARWLHKFNPKTSLRVKGRFETVDVDEASWDIVENLSLVGPTAGRTYDEVYGPTDALGYVTGELAWDKAEFSRRLSAANRDVLTAEANVVHRFGPPERRTRLKASLTMRDTDREYFAVTDDGSTRTKEYILGLQLRGHFGDRRYSYRVEGDYLQADDPFVAIDGGCRLTGTDPDAGPVGNSPGPWVTYQYFQLYDLRFANLTNQPTEGTTLRGNMTFSPLPNTSLTIQGRWTDEKNNETQVTDYQHESGELGAYLWWAPNPRLYALATAQVIRQEQEAHICIPLMDG